MLVLTVKFSDLTKLSKLRKFRAAASLGELFQVSFQASLAVEWLDVRILMRFR